MRQPVTMSDVARAAGVSPTTVSYVLSGKRPVAEATRSAVEAAVAELGFTLNTVARSLRTGRSTLIALVVPDIANPFYAQLASAVQDAVRVEGYHVVVGNTGAQRVEERAFLSEAVEQRFAGVVITPFRLAANDFDVLGSAGIPTIVSADVPFGALDLVTPDSTKAMRTALGHLRDSGRRRLAMIAGPQDATGGDPRLKRWARLAREFGFALENENVFHGEHTRAAGEEGFAFLMDAASRPDAVLCANDVVAVGALDAAEALGVDVPGEVALIGHDDVSFASLVRPRLTTIRYSAQEVGAAAADLLMQRLHGRTRRRTVRITAEYVGRASA